MILTPGQRYRAEHGMNPDGDDRKRGSINSGRLWPGGVVVYAIQSTLGKFFTSDPAINNAPNQSINQSINQSKYQYVNQSLNQSMNQSTNHSNKTAINQKIIQLMFNYSKTSTERQFTNPYITKTAAVIQSDLHVRPPLVSDHFFKTRRSFKSIPYSWFLP